VGWDGEVAGPFNFDPFANAATVIDSANILCKIYQTPDDFVPDFCLPSQPIQVTLHLYAASIPCQLLYIPYPNKYVIDFNLSYWPGCPKQLKGSIKLDEQPQDSWQFELVLMSRERTHGQNEFWLLRVDQPFAERIAFVVAVWEEGNLYDHLTGNYFRVR
jgi:hypothetical protein